MMYHGIRCYSFVIDHCHFDGAIWQSEALYQSRKTYRRIHLDLGLFLKYFFPQRTVQANLDTRTCALHFVIHILPFYIDLKEKSSYQQPGSADAHVVRRSPCTGLAGQPGGKSHFRGAGGRFVVSKAGVLRRRWSLCEGLRAE